MDLSACVIYHKPATISSDYCHDGQYCSYNCRNKDMLLHKLLCPFQRVQDKVLKPTSKSENIRYSRGLFLPSDSDRPRLVWVNYQRGRNGHSPNLNLKQNFGILVGFNSRLILKQDARVLVSSDPKSDINRHKILCSWAVQ